MADTRSSLGIDWLIQADEIPLTLTPVDAFKAEVEDGEYLVRGRTCYRGSGVVVDLWAEAILERFAGFASQPDIQRPSAIIAPFADGSSLIVNTVAGNIEAVRWSSSTEQTALLIDGIAATDRQPFIVALDGIEGELPAHDALIDALTLNLDIGSLDEYRTRPAPNQWVMAAAKPLPVPTKAAVIRAGYALGATVGLALLIAVTILVIPDSAPEPPPATLADAPLIDADEAARIAASNAPGAATPEVPKVPLRPSSVRWDLATFTMLAQSQMWRDLQAHRLQWMRDDDESVTIVVSGEANGHWEPAAKLWQATLEADEYGATLTKRFDAGGFDSHPPAKPLPFNEFCRRHGGIVEQDEVALQDDGEHCIIMQTDLWRLRANTTHAPMRMLSRAGCDFGETFMPACQFTLRTPAPPEVSEG